MSIVTRTGDQGTTGLMYNSRVPKCHPRVEAYGSVDELNSALGMARATASHEFVREKIGLIQKDLVTVMGELATAIDDLPKYKADGFKLVTSDLVRPLDLLAAELEGKIKHERGWAMPGGSTASAALDIARTTCRRAERAASALQESRQLQNPEIIIFLNRLSDVLWLLARWTDQN
jgi:cob(I)alamin adenosyltransferase